MIHGGKHKAPIDFDLNAKADSGFDLNKFTEEEFSEEGSQPLERKMLKILLPAFYNLELCSNEIMVSVCLILRYC